MTDPISNERLAELASGYETWSSTNSAQPQIDRDTASALRELQSRRQSPAGVEPAAWQRRLKYPDVAGAVPKWQSCSEVEATGYFEKSPHHEYRPLYASPPKAVTITDEMVERVFQAVMPFMAGTAYRELRAAITAALSGEGQSNG